MRWLLSVFFALNLCFKYLFKKKMMQSRQAGHRVGENLQSIIPLIVFYCQCKDEELVEYSSQAFESFVRRCPKEISNYIKDVFNLNLRSFKLKLYLKHGIPFWNMEHSGTFILEFGT